MTPAQAERLAAVIAPIPGWFFRGALGLFALIDEVQKAEGIEGDLFEIGCHHGKSTIALASMLRPGDERLGVCDIFEDQGLNVSGSGRGQRLRFEKNLERALGTTDFLDVHQKPSAELTSEDVGGPCRFFHVDGGHSVRETSGDLALAARAVSGEGVIVLDDALHPGWPSVAEGLFRFVLAEGQDFAPVIVGFNKMVLVRSAARGAYLSRFEDDRFWQPYLPPGLTHGIRRLDVCGQKTVCFEPIFTQGYGRWVRLGRRLARLLVR